MTNGRYKLISYYNLKEWELFDLQSDPQEMKSVYGDPQYADIQKQMETELARLRKELLVPENDPPESIRKPNPNNKAPSNKKAPPKKNADK